MCKVRNEASFSLFLSLKWLKQRYNVFCDHFVSRALVVGSVLLKSSRLNEGALKLLFFFLSTAIFLGSFRMPYDEIRDVVLEVDEEKLSEPLIQVCVYVQMCACACVRACLCMFILFTYKYSLHVYMIYFIRQVFFHAKLYFI